MSQRTGGPVVVRSDLLRDDSLRLWMSAEDGVLTLRTPSAVVSTIKLPEIKAVVLPELPYSFVLSDDSGVGGDVFCTFVDSSQRDEWLSFLQRLGVSIVNRRGGRLQRWRVSFE